MVAHGIGDGADVSLIQPGQQIRHPGKPVRACPGPSSCALILAALDPGSLRVRDDGIGEAFENIIPPHDALQLRELTDHAGDEVGLGEARGPFRHVRISADLRRQLARQRGDAVHLVGNAAQLFLEVDGGKLLRHRLERHLAVIVPEEARIIEPRREDAAITRSNRLAAIGCLDIRHHDKMRRKIARLRVTHGEIFLVGAHGELDDFARQGEEIGVHVAEDDDRPFGKPGHLVQQALVLDQFEAARQADLLGLLLDQQAAVFAAEDDRALSLNHRPVLLERGHGERPAPVDTVAFGLIPGFQAIDLEIDHLAVENAEHPLQWPHPSEVAAAPAHRFRPVEAAHHLRHERCNDVRQRAARNLAHGDVEIALFRVAPHLCFIDGIETSPAQEAFDGLLRRADLRAFPLFLHIGGLCRQPLDADRQAARTGQRGDLSKRDACLGQALFERRFQVGLGLGLHAGRDLFGKEFEEEFSHGVDSVPCL